MFEYFWIFLIFCCMSLSFLEHSYWQFLMQACALHVVVELCRDVRMVVEQPASSWGLKQAYMMSLRARAKMWLARGYILGQFCFFVLCFHFVVFCCFVIFLGLYFPKESLDMFEFCRKAFRCSVGGSWFCRDYSGIILSYFIIFYIICMFFCLFSCKTL